MTDRKTLNMGHVDAGASDTRSAGQWDRWAAAFVSALGLFALLTTAVALL